MNATTGAAGLDRAAFRDLEGSFRGRLVRPGDPSYRQDRRVWNGSVDRFPALIAHCTGVADVVAVLRFVRRTGLELAVRSGGHSFPGHSVCDDGVVADLSPMKGIRVDPEARTVRVQAGVLLGEMDRETQRFGLAVPSGVVTHTGVAGLTLGGGIGWLMRKYGLTVDQLLSVDLVTADGGLVTAGATRNEELFWGLRGGGGNFGIATEFEFRLHPVGPVVLAGPVVWPMAESARVMHFYRDWIEQVPDGMTTAVIHRRLLPSPDLPRELHGRPVVMVVCCWAGEVDEGERVVRPLRGFGPPLLDLCAPRPFVEHQAMLDPSFPHGHWYYFRSCNVHRLGDRVIDITAAHAPRSTSPLTSFPVFHLGGAVARVGAEETAFDGRDAGHTFSLNATCATERGFAQERQWARAFRTALEPFETGVYVNFLMDEGEDRVREAYGTRKYLRLRALKEHYDPGNLFHLNQNVVPGRH